MPVARRSAPVIAGGGNPVARGLDTMRVNLTAALESALAGVDRSRVAMAVLGLAGVTTYGEAFHRAIGECGAPSA